MSNHDELLARLEYLAAKPKYLHSEADAAMTDDTPKQEPAGTVNVPAEPTLEMIHQGALVLANHEPSAIGLAITYEVYRAMLAAAPQSVNADAAVGRVLFKYIDRLNDPAECDPLDKIVAELIQAINTAIASEQEKP